MDEKLREKAIKLIQSHVNSTNWADELTDQLIPLIRKATLREVKLITLKAIADEDEFPSDMPDELWKELDGNRENVNKAMRSAVRLTKNGITERFLKALKPGELPGDKIDKLL